MTHLPKVRCWLSEALFLSGIMTHMRVRGRSRGRGEIRREFEFLEVN
jgi:hypothetical protein